MLIPPEEILQLMAGFVLVLLGLDFLTGKYKLYRP